MDFSMNKIKFIYLWVFVIYFCGARPISAAFLDWIWTQNKDVNTFTHPNGPLIPVPFEYKTEDEKFLEEASKFTDLLKTSSLDLCQHKVILKIKTSCFSMTEEDLAKMSVNLLNCQSEVDERKIFPCTESMSLKECTKDMDANTWNAYHLMNNRARAVCLASRRTQFQALSEMTVNKLMATAHDQINKMTNLLEGQEKLESLTLGTLNSIEKGHIELMEQQEDLKTAQKKVQDFVTFNLEQLTKEKALIAAGNKELAKMTETIKEKLDEANSQLMYQSEERSQNHKKLLDDIETLQQQTHDIFKRIDLSTEKLLEQHEMASIRYKDAVDSLIKINDTVHYLLKMINSTRREIDERFYWIQDFLDGTGSSIERLSTITFHIVYLLVGMLFASFLNFSVLSRAVLATIVPLNLFVTYNHGSEMALDFSQLTVLLSFTVLSVAIIHKLQGLFSSKSHQFMKPLINGKILHPPNESIHSGGKKSSVSMFEYFSNIFKKFSASLYQLMSFINETIKQKLNLSNKQADKLDQLYINQSQPNRNEDDFISSSRLADRNGYSNHLNDYSTLRDRYQSPFNRVNDWLQTKVDYSPRPGSAASSTSSGSPRYSCSAMCRSGRRCKNPSSPGRDFCHRHLTGTSVAG